jgi:hypothetical protein
MPDTDITNVTLWVDAADAEKGLTRHLTSTQRRWSRRARLGWNWFRKNTTRNAQRFCPATRWNRPWRRPLDQGRGRSAAPTPNERGRIPRVGTAAGAPARRTDRGGRPPTRCTARAARPGGRRRARQPRETMLGIVSGASANTITQYQHHTPAGTAGC